MPKIKPNPAALVSSLTKSSAQSRLAALAGPDTEFEPLPTAPSVIDANKITSNEGDSAVNVATLLNDKHTQSESILIVSLDDLVEGPWNARKFYIKARIDELASDMKDQGQRVPINAYYDASRRLIIDDGHYRLRAARQAGMHTLRVQIIAPPATPLEGFKRSRASNKNRNDQSILDDAFRLKDLSETINITQRALGKELGYDDGDTSKLIALTKLSEGIILTVMADPTLLTKRFLYNLSLYFDRKGETATLQLAAEAVKNGMSARDLESRIKNADRGPKEKPRSEKFALEKGEAKGFVKTFPTGRVELRLDGLTEAEQGAITEKLRAILA